MPDIKFTLITDTTTDCTLDWFVGNDVKPIKHGLAVDGGEIWDECGTSITPHEVCELIRGGKKMSTLQGRLEEFLELFEQSCKNGLDAMYVGFSSGLSGTYATSCMAAKMMMEKYPESKIICVDTVAATMGQAILSMRALELRDSGAGVTEAAEKLEEEKLSVCHFFTVDDLNHLYRGGRLSKTSALVGTLIGIKPIMNVSDEGKLTPIDKVRGRMTAIRELARLTAEHIRDAGAQTIYITHGDVEDEANQLAEEVRKLVPDAKLDVRQLSPIIVVHSGPGTLAIFCRGVRN